MKTFLSVSLLTLAAFSLANEARASCSCLMGGREECGSYGCARLVNDQTGTIVSSYVRQGPEGAWASCHTMLLTYWRWKAECASPGSAPADASAE